MHYHHFGWVQVKISTKAVHGAVSGKSLSRVGGSGSVEFGW
jgi:hypothetical protein